MNAIEEKMITNAETLKLLEAREKFQDAPLSRMQMITVDFLKKETSKINVKKEKEVAEMLAKQVPSLKEFHIISILNCPPKDAEDVDVIFSKERISLDKAAKDKIVEIVKPVFKESKKTQKK
ncbi:MAG: hypothetical protein DRN66_02660 [Candidatus Nanohalarchaeota archaeon]|nr:MAG: hypothetical protein DRN66_02660 [Candidatus Nanohaloarchaeota archaeon]